MDALALINEHKNKILNIAIIVLALMISNNIYKSQNKAIKLLKEKKEAQIKKAAILENISDSNKRIGPYRGLFKNKDKFLVINNITNMARGLDVKVEAIRPLGEQGYPAYIKYPFEVIFYANDYHDIGQTIGKLENYDNEVYIIENITITPGQQSLEEKTYRFTVRLNGSSISLRDQL